MALNNNNNNSTPSEAKFCIANCGCYGSEANGGYCSVCAKRFNFSPAVTATASPDSSSASSSSSSSVSNNNDMMDITDSKPTTNSSSSSQSSSVGASTPSLGNKNTNSSSSTPSASLFIDPSLNLLPSNLLTPIKPLASGTSGTPNNASTATSSSTDNSKNEAAAAPVNRSRCFNCRKKVGLTGFECRCGNVFCGQHRYAEQHSCTFDYKAHDRAILDKLNPKVTGKKVDHI